VQRPFPKASKRDKEEKKERNLLNSAICETGAVHVAANIALIDEESARIEHHDVIESIDIGIVVDFDVNCVVLGRNREKGEIRNLVNVAVKLV